MTRQPTAKALTEGWARPTPLADGTPFFMWNRAKVAALLDRDGVARATPLEQHVRRVLAAVRPAFREADRHGSTIYYALANEVLDETVAEAPADIREAVRRRVLEMLKGRPSVRGPKAGLSPPGTRMRGMATDDPASLGRPDLGVVGRAACGPGDRSLDAGADGQ